MDQFFMDQIIDSFLEEECDLPNFSHRSYKESTSERNQREAREEADKAHNSCPRCGGPLYYGSCDCTWDPGDMMNTGGWSSGN